MLPEKITTELIEQLPVETYVEYHDHTILFEEFKGTLELMDIFLALKPTACSYIDIFFLNKETAWLFSVYFDKLKKRKWKYKKKKISRNKLLRRIRRFLIHRRVSKVNVSTMFITSPFWQRMYSFDSQPLTNKIPLTNRVIHNSYLEFFYKYNKNNEDISYNLSNFSHLSFYEEDEDDFVIYLRNYHQKPYWKLRISRMLHWEFFYNKKTLREQSYKGFLNKLLRNQKRHTHLGIYFVLFFTKMQLSWSRSQKLSSFLKKSLYINSSEVIKFLPTIISKNLNLNIFKKKAFHLKKKTARWSYLNYKRWQFPWLQKKKNFPKIIKHLQPNLFILKKLTQFDPMTGYLLFFKNINKYQLSFTELFKVNFLLKLHIYRYNSN